MFFVDVIPHVNSLKKYLENERDCDDGIKTMKRSLLDSVKRRLVSEEGGLNVFTDNRYVIPTVMDPR